jgi:LmbE family N-acetylglucosaminyl deacetylase
MLKPPFLGKKILIITAHPDDESYCAAGTLFANYKAKGENNLICASLGERGKSHISRPVELGEMKKIRKSELTRACALLHMRLVSVMGLPDGRLIEYKAKAFKKVQSISRRIKPDVILSFGSDGFSGHYDHIAIGSVARTIAKKLQIPFYAFALPQRVSPGAARWLSSRRRSGHYKFAVVFSKPKFRLAVNRSIKQQALRCHHSQMDKGKDAFTGFPPFAVKEILKAEYFTR